MLTSSALTDYARKVLRYYAAGLTQQQIAIRLERSEGAIKDCLDRVRQTYERLGRPIGDKTDFLKRAIEDGIVQPPQPR